MSLLSKRSKSVSITQNEYGLIITCDNIYVYNIQKHSKNFDKRPHRTSCRYRRFNYPFSLQAVTDHCDTSNVFPWVGQPPKLLILLLESGPHLVHSSLGPPGSVAQTASWYVQPGSRTWQTDRQTDRPQHYVCSNRPLSLINAAMRPNNKLESTHRV